MNEKCTWYNADWRDDLNRPICGFDQRGLEPHDCENCPFFETRKESVVILKTPLDGESR